MKRLEVSGAVRPIYGSLGVKRLRKKFCPKRRHVRARPDVLTAQMPVFFLVTATGILNQEEV